MSSIADSVMLPFAEGLSDILPDSISAEFYPDVQEGVLSLQQALSEQLPFPVNEETLRAMAFGIPFLLWYMFATPGSLAGILDLLYAPLHSTSLKQFNADDVDVGRQMGEGSFGVVFEGFIGAKKKGSRSEPLQVVLKKVKSRVEGAEEMSETELVMNLRLKRTAPNAVADFLGTVDVKPKQASGRLTEGLWLVWRYQGDRTLDYYLKQRGFPETIADIVLGDKAPKVQGSSKIDMLQRDYAVIREVMGQILQNLRAIHRSGVIHRDVKPLNLVLALDHGMFKLIDLGAAVDLRSGQNYRPDETVMDPIYAAPEQYVMATNSMSPPPAPIYTLMSPFVWALNCPDRFDMFSAGLVMMQLCVKPLRSDSGLQTFNAEFKRCSYDLDKWRRKCRFGDNDFAILDANDGAGWDLVRGLLQPRTDGAVPSMGIKRPSAAEALNHRFFKNTSWKSPSSLVEESPEPRLSTAGQAKIKDKKAEKEKKEKGRKLKEKSEKKIVEEKKSRKPVALGFFAWGAVPTDRAVEESGVTEPNQRQMDSARSIPAKAAVDAAPQEAASTSDQSWRWWATEPKTAAPIPEVEEPVATSSPADVPGPAWRLQWFSEAVTPAESAPEDAPNAVNGKAAVVAEVKADRRALWLPFQAAEKQAAPSATPNREETEAAPLPAFAVSADMQKQAANTALVLAMALFGFSFLRASTELSYQMGNWMASSVGPVGLSLTSALVVFLLARPLMEELERKENAGRSTERSKDAETRSSRVLAEIEDRAFEILPEAVTRDAEDLQRKRRASRQPREVDTMMGRMETQLSSLEDAIRTGRELRHEQLQLLTKMEGLLLPTGNTSTSQPPATNQSKIDTVPIRVPPKGPQL
eukprot:TRINITY_DN3088_c0_g2_i1.p1 TRINITY_DN3088_c0_g2~~TRINITY_DN3088_c0_g2_i1.p1  ORF type:complete len:915 (-),score=225.33 TRINITY_DN3088_c0_g2_i1:507-3098(-)